MLAIGLVNLGSLSALKWILAASGLTLLAKRLLFFCVVHQHNWESLRCYGFNLKLKRNVDSILMGIGLVFLFLIMPMIVNDETGYQPVVPALVDCVENSPLVGIPAFCFAVAGCSLVTVSTLGIFNRYQSPEDRFESFFKVYFVELVIFVGLGLVSLGLKDTFQLIPIGHFRLIGLIVGTLGALLVGNQLSFPPAIMQWACVLGGLFGFALGPVFYYLLFFLIVVLFVQPIADQIPGVASSFHSAQAIHLALTWGRLAQFEPVKN